MSKYVQARFESYMPAKALNAIDHDFRKKAPDYLRDEHFHNSFQNHVFGMQNSTDVKRAMHEDREAANDAFHQKNGRNLRANRDSSYLAAVVTLSNTIIEELERGEITEAELNAAFEKTAERMRREISEVCGEEIGMYYGVVHYDEKTPHMHIAFHNRTADGASVYHRLKHSGYFSRVQDMTGEEFQHFGYERGVKKSKTNAKHKNIRQMHEAEIDALKAEIRAKQAEKKALQDQNRKLIADRDANRAEIEKNNEAKRAIQDEVNELKEKRRSLEAKSAEYEHTQKFAEEFDPSPQERHRPKIKAEKYEEGVFSKKSMRKMTERDYGALVSYIKELESRVEEFEKYEFFYQFEDKNKYVRAKEAYHDAQSLESTSLERAKHYENQAETAKAELEEAKRLLSKFDGNTIVSEAKKLEKQSEALRQKEQGLQSAINEQEKLAKEIDQEQARLKEWAEALDQREAKHANLLIETKALRQHYAKTVISEKISELVEKKGTDENLNRGDFKGLPDEIFNTCADIANAKKIEDVPEFEMKAIDTFAKNIEDGFNRAHTQTRTRHRMR
jgi:hypothetical protein